jgi:hypothetical protein
LKWNSIFNGNHVFMGSWKRKWVIRSLRFESAGIGVRMGLRYRSQKQQLEFRPWDPSHTAIDPTIWSLILIQWLVFVSWFVPRWIEWYCVCFKMLADSNISIPFDSIGFCVDGNACKLPRSRT